MENERIRARRRKRRRIRIDYRKAVRALALLVLVVWVIISVLSPAFGVGTSFDRALIRESGDPSAAAPKIKASCAAMYSLDLDQMVYEKNADMKMPPYSVTKLLTCYLALENLDQDQIVTVSKKAAEVLWDGTSIELKEGEEISVKDLIYGAMMASGNDAATALGEAVSGDVSKFSKLMNKTASEWGCENTHFVNANGWDNEKHYTTARDMAIIARNCLSNDTLRAVSVTKKYTIPATNMSEERVLSNALLYTEKKLKVLTGGKTGSWSEDECALAMEFSDKGLSAVIILLGDTKKGRVSDPKKLIPYAYEVTPGFKVTDSDEAVCDAWVKHGAETRVPLSVKGLRYAYPKNMKASGVKIETEVEKLTAPVKKGDKAGKYYIYANDELVGKGNLYASKDVETGWFTSNLYIPNNNALIMFLILALVITLSVLIRKR